MEEVGLMCCPSNLQTNPNEMKRRKHEKALHTFQCFTSGFARSCFDNLCVRERIGLWSDRER